MHFATVAAAVLSLAVSVTQAQTPIPPAGLFCCPPYGPGGRTLDRQQLNPYAIFCYYDEGTEQGCFYDPGTGGGGGPAAGCPVQAITNPHPPTCPV
ncbi:hypothetical protein FPV67DRAFT_301461 [Lyophyllum atratum]|nr:hypothetical protein FPV67DRAFT_301461 [Lyophyllum atratum]